VNFQLLRLSDVDLGEELTNIVSLVALKLDDLSVLGMLDDGAVTGEILLACPDYLLFIKVIRNSLHGCEGLATVTLLDTNVNQAVLHALIIASDGVRKRIKCLEVLDARHANSVKNVCLRNENALTTAVDDLELTALSEVNRKLRGSSLLKQASP